MPTYIKNDNVQYAPADFAPVIHGHWNFIDAEEEGDFYAECSVCNKKFLNFTSNYCPNCGAKMDEKECKK